MSKKCKKSANFKKMQKNLKIFFCHNLLKINWLKDFKKKNKKNFQKNLHKYLHN